MRISDWSSDVCSSDLTADRVAPVRGKLRLEPRGIGRPPVVQAERLRRHSRDAERARLRDIGTNDDTAGQVGEKLREEIATCRAAVDRQVRKAQAEVRSEEHTLNSSH